MNMTEVKTSELEGAALDWAVASAESEDIVIHTIGQYRYDKRGGIHCCKYGCTFGPRSITHDTPRYEPSEDWGQAGALIEKYMVSIEYGVNQDSFPGWSAIVGPVTYMQEPDAMGKTPIIAAMRAIVAAGLGDVVSVPSELLEPAK